MIKKERFIVNFKLGEEIIKMKYPVCRGRGTENKSESPVGIKLMTFRTPVGRSNY